MKKYVISQNVATNEWEIKDKNNDEMTYGRYKSAREALIKGHKRFLFERLYNASISEKFGILTFFMTLLCFIIKVLFEWKYNSYFCIPDTWNSNFIEDILSQIMFYAGTFVIVLVTNFLIYFLIIHAEKIIKAIFIALPFIIVSVFVFFHFRNNTLKEKIFLFVVLFFSLFWMGWFMGISKFFTLNISMKKNKTNNKCYKRFCIKKISPFVYVGVILLLFFFIGNLGLAFAKERKTFQVTTIDNQNMVIMAEKDNLYLLAIYSKNTENEIEIDVNEFYPLPKDKISIISGKSFTGNKIVKKTSFSLTQYHQTFVAKNEQYLSFY